jgi:P27 family predicted phage terminase small subunit
MGRRGPKPQPTSLRIVRGNPGKRAINVGEPEPVAGEEKDWVCPVELKGAAKAEWERQVKDLRESGILTLADRMVFVEYCEAVGELERYKKAAHGVSVQKAMALGYQGMVLKLRAQVKQLAAELGITPSSRSGVKTAKRQLPKGPMTDKFFKPQRDLFAGRAGGSK